MGFNMSWKSVDFVLYGDNVKVIKGTHTNFWTGRCGHYLKRNTIKWTPEFLSLKAINNILYRVQNWVTSNLRTAAGCSLQVKLRRWSTAEVRWWGRGRGRGGIDDWGVGGWAIFAFKTARSHVLISAILTPEIDLCRDIRSSLCFTTNFRARYCYVCIFMYTRKRRLY